MGTQQTITEARSRPGCEIFKQSELETCKSLNLARP
jgi:hypothetical protein